MKTITLFTSIYHLADLPTVSITGDYRGLGSSRPRKENGKFPSAPLYGTGLIVLCLPAASVKKKRRDGASLPHAPAVGRIVGGTWYPTRIWGTGSIWAKYS